MKGFNINNNKGKVYQYDLDGKFICEFEHCVEAQDVLNCSNLHEHLEKGYPKTIQGHIFSRTYYIKYPSELLPKKTRINSGRVTPILQYDLDGNLIKEWNVSTHVISKTLKTSRGNMVQALNGKRKTAGGFIWKYKE